MAEEQIARLRERVAKLEVYVKVLIVINLGTIATTIATTIINAVGGG